MLVPLSPNVRRVACALACIVASAAIACAQAAAEPLPLAYVAHAAGPAARPVFVLGWALLALCTFVCIAIATLLALALFRRRRREARGGDGVRFVAIGSAVSAVLLFGALVYMLRVLGAVAYPPRPPVLTITVIAHDWWWAVRYPGEPALVTANEIHIPVGEPIAIELKSADVIHAFWVPQLAGKTETIPGQTNRQWLQADRAGVYRGQCSQYCGAQHAHMAFDVVAQPPDAFRACSPRAARAATRCAAPTRPAMQAPTSRTSRRAGRSRPARSTTRRTTCAAGSRTRSRSSRRR